VSTENILKTELFATKNSCRVKTTEKKMVHGEPRGKNQASAFFQVLCLTLEQIPTQAITQRKKHAQPKGEKKVS